MNVQAKRGYRRPAYPDRETFLQHPERLLNHSPSRWLKKGAAAGALLAFVGAGKIPAAEQQSTASRAVVMYPNQDSKKFTKEKKEAKRKEMKIAPLFIHGDGVGVTGCVVVSPPVFLSESEALALIESELRRAGLDFVRGERVVPGLEVQEREEYFESDKALKDLHGSVRQRGEKHPFYFDFYSGRHGVGLKFVSQQNYFKLGGIRSASTVQEYDMIAVAQRVKERVQQAGLESGAFFYEPLEGYRSTQGEENMSCSREQLVKQVADFISWFNSQFSNGDSK